ncbi:glutathione S-transferase protein [Rutstroemia sp. NJR-2017a BBW]|nr:glutathione S-transferase protein [Rutstroemia sp. NJR-2017a BBW]
MSSSSFYLEGTPEDVKNAKGLHIVTQSTPNGKKVQIMLEELNEVYGIDYTHTLINIQTNEQKKDWFLKLNPNGELIPTIPCKWLMISRPNPDLDRQHKDPSYDSKDVFGFKDELERNECLQWLFFWHGSGAPYQGQVNYFSKFASEKSELAINRFRNEFLRVLGVLEIRLSGKYTSEPREYLAGNGKGKYSVADIGTWPWVSGWDFSGEIKKEEMDQFPHLLKWIDRIAQRSAVKSGTGKKWQAQ